MGPGQREEMLLKSRIVIGGDATVSSACWSDNDHTQVLGEVFDLMKHQFVRGSTSLMEGTRDIVMAYLIDCVLAITSKSLHTYSTGSKKGWLAGLLSYGHYNLSKHQYKVLQVR